MLEKHALMRVAIDAAHAMTTWLTDRPCEARTLFFRKVRGNTNNVLQTGNRAVQLRQKISVVIVVVVFSISSGFSDRSLASLSQRWGWVFCGVSGKACSRDMLCNCIWHIFIW